MPGACATAAELLGTPPRLPFALVVKCQQELDLACGVHGPAFPWTPVQRCSLAAPLSFREDPPEISLSFWTNPRPSPPRGQGWRLELGEALGSRMFSRLRLALPGHQSPPRDLALLGTLTAVGRPWSTGCG